jgi:hypothetical protein
MLTAQTVLSSNGNPRALAPQGRSFVAIALFAWLLLVSFLQ